MPWQAATIIFNREWAQSMSAPTYKEDFCRGLIEKPVNGGLQERMGAINERPYNTIEALR